jgi:hypothetical protein
VELIALVVVAWPVALVAGVVLGHALAGRSPARPRRPRR